MKFNRSHLQVKIMQLEKFDWKIYDKNKIRYKRYFDSVAPILDPETRKELNKKIDFFCRRWMMDIMEAEKIIFNSFFFWRGEPIKQTRIFEKTIGEKTIRYTKLVDIFPNAIEKDLADIRLWCSLKLIETCKKHELNFEELIKIEQK